MLSLFITLLCCILPAAVVGFSIRGETLPSNKISSQGDNNNLLRHVLTIEEASPSFEGLLTNIGEEEQECNSLQSKSTSKPTRELPPVLQQIADERQEYNMNVGKAMDTLRKDMPEILNKLPDFSIYHEEIQAIDPSGVRLTGLDKYKSVFAFFQTFIRFWFAERSGLQFRMVYDFCRSSIRISWHAVLVPKVPLGKPLLVDGISIYKLDVKGQIIEHKIENLVINNNAVVPPYGMFSILQQDILGNQQSGVPVGAT
jgi:hypothetical protein